MSDTVKLIIEIPKDYYEVMQRNEVILGSPRSGETLTSVIYSAIAHGTPLDDVKALIEYNAEIHEDGDSYLMEQWVYDILDGKYKVEGSKEDNE